MSDIINTKKINNIIIQPLNSSEKKKPVLGCELFPQLNANIFLCAPKNSGKTINIKLILEECADKNTHVIIFCGTVNQDTTWLQIKKDLRKRNIKYSAYDSIYHGKINLVDLLIENLNEEHENDNHFTGKENQSKPSVKFNFGTPIPDPNSKIVIKKTNKKYDSPKYIIIFDDLSTELKDKSISKMMKIHRHYCTKVIISSQSWIDTDSRIRKGNLDYVLLFKNIPDPVIEQIHEELSLAIELDKFKTLYKHATAKPYHFLYIDRCGKYRKDWCVEYMV